MDQYLKLLHTRTGSVFSNYNITKYVAGINKINISSAQATHKLVLEQAANLTDELRENMLSLLLGEAQGSVRPLSVRSSDILLSASEQVPLDGKLRFQLGVGLAKLGLFELSMKHVRLAATPWEAPLHALRAMLVLAPVHTSVRALAAAVEQFESQAEAVLVDDALPQSFMMQQTCSSPEDVSLVLQALPLLHLAGSSAPYHYLSGGGSKGGGAAGESFMLDALGYPAISLAALLSEVYQHICPAKSPVDEILLAHMHRITGADKAQKSTAAKVAESSGSKKIHSLIKIGIVAGSFDNIPGKIMIGLLESMSEKSRMGVKFTAMCFPTPRDGTTDRVNGLFDDHINLSAGNKTLVRQRILDHGADIILFADAALDSRVFAIAHERLAPYQALLWHWGGTLGIPTIDFYFIPEILWRYSKCAQLQRGPSPPQSLFSEQVVLLEGLPYVTAQSPQVSKDEVRAILQSRYLLPVNNQTHIYVFPGSVKHLHPEFDRAIDVILKTDPLAMVVLAVARSGRDNVPPTHIAVRHDLMHPSQPAAAVAKCLRRLRGRVGLQNIDRVRVLPPVDEALLRGLQQLAVAVLDPFPVGMHLPVLQAMLDQVPVLSAFALQECTNSHAFNIARYLNISAPQIHSSGDSTRGRVSHNNVAPAVSSSNTDNFETSEHLLAGSDHSGGAYSLFPTTPEEYGVWAVRLQREPAFRSAFIAKDRRVLLDEVKASKSAPTSHGEQLLAFIKTILFDSRV